MPTEADTVVQNPSIVHVDVGESLIMLDPQAGQYYEINDVGARIWEMATAPVRLDHLIDGLLEIYDVDRAGCDEAVLPFIEELLASGILVRGPAHAASADAP